MQVEIDSLSACPSTVVLYLRWCLLVPLSNFVYLNVCEFVCFLSFSLSVPVCLGGFCLPQCLPSFVSMSEYVIFCLSHSQGLFMMGVC